MKLIEVALMLAEQKHALKQKLIEETGNKNIKDYDVDILVEPVSYTHLTLPTICSV